MSTLTAASTANTTKTAGGVGGPVSLPLAWRGVRRGRRLWPLVGLGVAALVVLVVVGVLGAVVGAALANIALAAVSRRRGPALKRMGERSRVVEDAS